MRAFVSKHFPARLCDVCVKYVKLSCCGCFCECFIYRTLCHHKVHSEPVFALDASISSSGVAVVSGGGDNLLVRSSLETRLLPWALSVTDTVSLKHPGRPRG